MRTQVVQEFGPDPGMVQRIRRPSSPNRRHFGRGACSTRCAGVHPKTACSLATRWCSFSRRSPRRLQLPRTTLKAPIASCRVATLGSRSSAEAAQRSAPMSFSRANVWASSAPFSRDFSFSSAACPPANVTYNQAIQIVTAYISARPQRIQERFIDLATEALHDAWPCKPNLK